MPEITPKYLPPLPIGTDAALRSMPAPPRFRSGGTAAAETPRFEIPEVVPSPTAPVVEAASGAKPAGAAEDDPALRKLRDATEQFEAYFVGYLLKTMRSAVSDDDGLFPISQGQKVFRDMLDDETAKSMSKTRQMGLADMMYRDMAPALGAVAQEEKP